MKKINIKDKIENYYPKLIYLTETVLKRYLNHIKKIIKVEEKFGQKKLIKNKSIFTLVLASFYHFSGSKGFIFYLTKTQIKELTESRKEGVFKGRNKVLKNKDLIPTSINSPTDGVNILKNILNYPETKRILGISLTSDLKEKIKNLDSEAPFGMANILSSLLTANRGKMSICSINRNQLKEIIEGFITTLSVLLNPAQKY